MVKVNVFKLYVMYVFLKCVVYDYYWSISEIIRSGLWYGNFVKFGKRKMRILYCVDDGGMKVRRKKLNKLDFF